MKNETKKTTMFAGVAFSVGLVIVIVGNAMNHNRPPALRTEALRQFGMSVCLIGLSTFLIANLMSRYGKTAPHPRRIAFKWTSTFTANQFINWVSVSGMVLFGLVGLMLCFSIFTEVVSAGFGTTSLFYLIFISIWPLSCLMLVLLFLIMFMLNKRLTVVEQRQCETPTFSAPTEREI